MKKLPINTRKLCDGMKGQNYWFNGCMEYAMECLGEDIKTYDYWFFSNITGDSLTQLYSKDPNVTAWCPSCNVFDHAFARRAFDACGYEFEHVPGVTDANRAGLLPRIKASIDRGVPVICRGGGKIYEYANICGYDGDTLLLLVCDKDAPQILPGKFTELVFIGAKKGRPAPAEVFKRTLMAIPAFLTRPATSAYSFGKQAFMDWAGSFQNGAFDNVPASHINAWNAHGTHLCMLGTNGCANDLLRRARETNPALAPQVDALAPLYNALSEIFHELAYRDGGLRGGFNITPETIKDKAQMKVVSDAIMRAAAVCDDILRVFQKT